MCAGASVLFAVMGDLESGAGEAGLEEDAFFPDFLVAALDGIGVPREAEAGVVFRRRLAADGTIAPSSIPLVSGNNALCADPPSSQTSSEGGAVNVPGVTFGAKLMVVCKPREL